MQDSNNPQSSESKVEPVQAFRPAPNPFEKSTAVSPEKYPVAEEVLPPVATELQDKDPESDYESNPSAESIELVGKRADEKPESGLLEPPKKRSLAATVFSPFSAKPDPNAVAAKPNRHNTKKAPEQTLLSWQAPEFVQTHKPAGWYIGFGAFFLILIATALFTGQYLTVGLFAIMAVVLVIYANRTPRVLNYQITNYGVSVGEKKYLYDDFGSYYQANDYGQTVLELVPNKRLGTLVSLPPAQDKFDTVEKTLNQMLPKVDNRDDLADKIFRALRF